MLRGTLAVGTEQCIAGVDVAKLLAAFRRRHPDVEIRLRQWGSAALAEEVAAGRLDLAFAYRVDADPDQLRVVPLTGEPVTVLCHPDHRLARAGAPVTPRDLADEVFVDFHPDWGRAAPPTRRSRSRAYGARWRWR